jgi:hypothetical protein
MKNRHYLICMVIAMTLQFQTFGVPVQSFEEEGWNYSQDAPTGPTSVRSMQVKTQTVAAGMKSSWTAVQPIPAGNGVARYGHAQCDQNPHIFYVISGVNESSTITDKLWRYNVITDTWTELTPIPVGREGLSAICYNGYLYAVGGGFTNQFYIYDIAANSWSSAPPLPRIVWGAALGVYNNRLYVAGGDNDFYFGGVSDQVNIYDIDAGAWSGTGALMPVAAATPGFAQAGSYLYVVGGWGNSSPGANVNQTQRYDMASDTWETGPVFSSARGDLALAITETHLYAIGGDADGGGAFDATTLVERLDHTVWPAGIWEVATPLPLAITAMKGGFTTNELTGGEIWTVGGYTGAINGITQYLPAEPRFGPPPVAVPLSSVAFLISAILMAGFAMRRIG